MNEGFLVCPPCEKWGWLPSGFSVIKTFGVCPICSKSMKFLDGYIFKPDEIGLSERKRVEVSVLRPAR
jgi:hypothetical protein